MAVDRRRVLKTALGCGSLAAGVALLKRTSWPLPRGMRTTTPVGQRPFAHRLLVQAEDSWGLSATSDQFNAPVTSGWTWIAFDQWQAPRRESAIIGTGAFLCGGAAVTVASSGRLWQDVEIQASGSYRLFLRLVDFGGGINRIVVECGGVSHACDWGSPWHWLTSAGLLRRIRGVQSLISWREVGVFPLTAGTRRVTIDVERADQSYLMLDALYFTDDASEPRPIGWNPLAQPIPSGAPVKRAHTVVTVEEIETARANVKRFGWARAQGDNILGTARHYADRPDEDLWRLMPSSRIPRAASPAERGAGCPVHGREVERLDEPWRLDPFGHPYQIQCGVGGEWYPERIDLSSDERIRLQALREAGSGRRQFIRHYCHEVFIRHVRPAATALGRAYALTGDRVYAHKAAVLLSRVAEEYPDGLLKRDRAYQRPYSYGSGAIVNTVWSGADLGVFAECYDLIFDGIAQDNELVRFLKSKLARLDSDAAIRCWIEEALLRNMARAALDGAIHANPGTYESGLAAVALCLDDFESGRYPDSAEMIRAVYEDQHAQESSWSIPKRYLTNFIHPNGFPDSSVDYGSLVLTLIEFGERMEQLRRLHPGRFDAARYPNILRHPRLRRLLDFLTDVVCLQRYHPALGDGHGKDLWSSDNLLPVQVPARIATLAYPQAIDALFRVSPDPALARLIIEREKFDGEVYRPLFRQSLADDIRERDVPAHRPRGNSLLDDHGVVLLRAGTDDDERVLYLNYRGGPGDHRHADRLAIGLFGHGLDLMPELPYMPSLDLTRLKNFEHHPLLHNTITFDRTAEADGPAYLARLVETPRIQAATARSAANGHRRRDAERTCVLVSVDPTHWYVLDVMHASGGAEHHLGIHTAVAQDITVRGIALQPRSGTMASPAGRYGEKTNGPGGSEDLHPFCFMTDVASGTLDRCYSVDHRFGDAADVHLRMWGIAPAATSITMTDARPPLDPSAYRLRCTFAHRAGSAPLITTFATVFEPYRGSGFIERVETVPVESPSAHAIAVRVVMADRIDTFIVNPEGARLRMTEGTATDARLALYSGHAGRVDTMFVVCGTGFSTRGIEPPFLPQAYWSGEIISVDRVRDSLVVSRSEVPPIGLESRPIRVHNDFRSRMYRIVGATVEQDRVRLRLERSSLVAEGVAVGFQAGVVLNKALMPFATAGCTLESADGTARWRIVGRDHVGHAGTDLVVRDSDGAQPSAATLERAFRGGRAFTVHGYGPGDRFELATHFYRGRD